MKRTIGRLAKELDIGIEAIRFYEQKGLISQPPKPDSGYRTYPESTVVRLVFIKRAKLLGFTLGEIKRLLEIDDLPCAEMATLASTKLRLVQSKIASLVQLERGLKEIVSTCHTNKNKQNCPIMSSLFS